VSHAYVVAGDYTVTLTVTDNAGATSSVSHVVTATAPPPDQPPTARFTWTCTGLTCTFDGTTSSDPEDVTVSGYSWDLGDGHSATQGAFSHTFDTAGTYDVTLTVADDDDATAQVTHELVVTGAPANQVPVAVFSGSCVGLVCSFDGSGSWDPDGSVVSYGWSFGDGGSGSGVSVSHGYAAGGAVTVTLTVTDDQGGSSSVSHVFAPVAGAGSPFVSDVFGRTVSGGWGSADVGGVWSRVGTAAQFSVAPGGGVLALAKAGQTLEGFVGPAQTDADVTEVLSASRVPVGGPLYLSVTGRRVGVGSSYFAKVLVNANGSVTVRVARLAGGVETSLAGPVTVSGLTYVAGMSLSVRVQVFGTSPSTVRARVWRTGQAEPSSWQVSGTDSTAGLQSGGAVGTTAYLSSSATNAPETVTVTSFTARPTGP
jgi:PKD repeat protein